MEETVQLTVHETECGRYRVCDQHGRVVKGVTALSLHADVDDAIRINIDVIVYRDGKVQTNRAAGVRLIREVSGDK